MTRPLDGIKLVELSSTRATAQIAQFFADYGAAEIDHVRAFAHQLLAEREDVGTASICEREFEQAGIAELFERPAGAPRQQRGARRFGV